MEIRGSSGAVWVVALPPDAADGTTPGEVVLRVDVSSCGFTGCMFPCVRVSALRQFAAALEELRDGKLGEAILRGLADDFVFRVAWEQRDLGPRLAATGHITRYADASTDGGPHANVLRFGLDFHEAALAGVVAEARAMAGGKAKPSYGLECQGTDSDC